MWVEHAFADYFIFSYSLRSSCSLSESFEGWREDYNRGFDPAKLLSEPSLFRRCCIPTVLTFFLVLVLWWQTVLLPLNTCHCHAKPVSMQFNLLPCLFFYPAGKHNGRDFKTIQNCSQGICFLLHSPFPETRVAACHELGLVNNSAPS